ncbi:hypothetical protein [Desnuesiella massiliensis]|uniref:hypothetical protein n=1 Tax=Desnuesiella massiliensis TaxID=1650662 RepID=UPI0006E2D666|nr:hypothetical protein [Desnuesiella massiliensis]
MCYFMLAASEKQMENSFVEKCDEKALFIREYTDYIKDRQAGLHYYNISNGHCACELVVSPFSKVEEVKEALKELKEMGDFRFLIIDSEDEDEYFTIEHNQEFEKTLESLPKQEISIEELLSIYPEYIEFDKVYGVK